MNNKYSVWWGRINIFSCDLSPMGLLERCECKIYSTAPFTCICSHPNWLVFVLFLKKARMSLLQKSIARWILAACRQWKDEWPTVVLFKFTISALSGIIFQTTLSASKNGSMNQCKVISSTTNKPSKITTGYRRANYEAMVKFLLL